MFLFVFTSLHIDALGIALGRRREKRALDMIVQFFIKHLICMQPCTLPCVHWACSDMEWRRGNVGYETDKRWRKNRFISSSLISEPNPGASSQQAVPGINLQGAFKSSLAINQNEEKKKVCARTFLWERTEKKSLISCLEWGWNSQGKQWTNCRWSLNYPVRKMSPIKMCFLAGSMQTGGRSWSIGKLETKQSLDTSGPASSPLPYIPLSIFSK